MTDTIHYDKDLSGTPLCGIVDYDHAHEDLDKVTCKSCIKSYISKLEGGELVALLRWVLAKKSNSEIDTYILINTVDQIGKVVE